MADKPKLKLKPCPFCRVNNSSTASFDEGGHTLRQRTLWHVVCWKCEASGPTTDSEEHAVAQWNCRGGVE